MKRRLQIAMTMLANHRELLILDEPTNGLDLNGILWLKDFLINMKQQGKTILLSSHSILELQDILTDYIILNSGVITKKGLMAEMKSEYLIIEVKIEEFEKAVQCFSEKDVKFSIGAPIITVSLNKDIAYYIQILTAHHVYPISYFRKQESLIEQFHEYAGDDKNE